MLNENCFSGFVLPTLQITDNSEKRLREIVLTNFVAHINKTIETISFNTKPVNSIINSKFTGRQFSVCIGGKLVDPKPMPCFEFL